MDPAAVDIQFGQRLLRALRLTEQTYIAAQHIHVTERIGALLRIAVQHVEPVPLPGSDIVRHGIEQLIRTIAAEHDRLVQRAVGGHIAQSKDDSLVVHVERCTGINRQVAAEDQRIEHQIRFVCFQMFG